MSSEIIGQTLSLITKAESRYVGTLVQVDTTNKTMSLKHVKNMGTEGRRNQVNEIPPSDSLLGMVKFKVELIKEFNIVKPDTAEEDPAILESTEVSEEEKKQVEWTRGTHVVKSGEGEEKEAQDRQEPQQHTRKFRTNADLK